MAHRQKKRKPKNSNVRKNQLDLSSKQDSEKLIVYMQLLIEIFKFINLMVVELKLEEWLAPVIHKVVNNILF